MDETRTTWVADVTHVNSMKPLDVQLGAIWRISPNALPIQRIGDMVGRVRRWWRGWRLLTWLLVFILLRRSCTSTASPWIDRVYRRGKVRLLHLPISCPLLPIPRAHFPALAERPPRRLFRHSKEPDVMAGVDMGTYVDQVTTHGLRVEERQRELVVGNGLT